MTTFQKVIKYLAMAFAIFLSVNIIGGILGAVGLFFGLSDGGSVLEDVKTYAVSDGITELSIKINAADLTIKESDSFSVESNLKHLTIKEENGVLTIKDDKKLSLGYSDAMLTLYIPSNTVFEKATITTGAGSLTADNVSASSVYLKLGAGEVNIGTLNANGYADIDGGAGKITVSGGTLHGLDLDMGVGQLNLTSALSGDCDLELGVGESNITLIGSKNDYNISVDKGLGSITVDGKNTSDFGSGGVGKNNIDIDGGVGAINLQFREKDE